jgi:hypothetical protein
MIHIAGTAKNVLRFIIYVWFIVITSPRFEKTNRSDSVFNTCTTWSLLKHEVFGKLKLNERNLHDMVKPTYRCKLFPNTAQVPETHTTIAASRGEKVRPCVSFDETTVQLGREKAKTFSWVLRNHTMVTNFELQISMANLW